MPVLLNPYLAFRDTAEEAMSFYRSVFGGELTIMRFSEYGASEDPAEGDKVMHAMLSTDEGMVLMASDTPTVRPMLFGVSEAMRTMPSDTPNSMGLTVGDNVSISVGGEDETVLRGWWAELSDGGSVTMPLDRPPWGGLFGMCTDRFGVHWMISVADPAP